MKKTIQKGTDVVANELNTKWFVGLKKFVWVSKMHLADQLKNPMN